MNTVKQTFEYKDGVLTLQRNPGDKIELKMSPWKFILLLRHGIYDMFISSRYRKKIENPETKYPDTMNGVLQFIKDENFKELGRYNGIILFAAKSKDDKDDIHFRALNPELGKLLETCISFRDE